MVRKNLKTMMMALLMVSGAAYADEKTNDASFSAFMKSVGAGSVAGLAEVLVNQPQVYVKLGFQLKKTVAMLVAEVKRNPLILYQGLRVGMVCVVPATAAQVGFDQALEEVMPGSDTATAVQRNALAGATSALLSNPAELVVVNQQKLNAKPWPTIKALYMQNGAQVVMRGFTSKALRDSLFCAGFLTAYPQAKALYKQHHPDAQPWESTLAATAAVGPITTAVSHPFDTLSAKMQADPAKETMHGWADAIKSLKTKDMGYVRTAYAGLLPRTLRVMVAIPLMSAVKDTVKEALNNP